jgi:hypothetical protein
MITKANQKMFNTYIEQLNSKLNIVNILKKLEMSNVLEQFMKMKNKKMKEDEIINLNISRLQRHGSKNKGLIIRTPRTNNNNNNNNIEGNLSPQVVEGKKNLLLKQSGTIKLNLTTVKTNLEE